MIVRPAGFVGSRAAALPESNEETMPTRADAGDVREAEDLIRRLFAIDDEHDVLLYQAEAIALLEGATKSLAAPETSVISILTSIYGEDFNAWAGLTAARTASLDLRGLDRAVTPDEVAELLDATEGKRVLAIVQGEALTGVVNPIDAIAAVAASRGVALMIDSVSSVGSEPFTPGAWGRAISVIGTQKALGGPAGISAAVIEKSMWGDLEANPAAPRRSFLSLLDLKHNWLDTDRTRFPGYPNGEELLVLLGALRTAVEVGIDAIERRHQDARRLARDIVRGLPGLALTVAEDEASGLATTFELEDPSLERASLLADLADQGVGVIKTAPGPRTLRWLHYDNDAERAEVERVGAALAALTSAGAAR
jgi:aspartate aminotransferase-like enzyme